MRTRSNIFLVGPMGAGKTTVGRRLAELRGLQFADSDHEIEQRTGVDIAFIFEKEGEAGFRKREKQVIAELTAGQGLVLATGGGAVLDADTATPRLLASGTASIVGHVSQHVGDCTEQLHESLRNLDALLAEAAAKTGRVFRREGCEALRIYLRHDADLAAAQAVMAGSGVPADRISYLRGDVCRRELDVELEGVFAAS